MKKTTKTLLSLLLVLVMALQFGAIAPAAHAADLPGDATVKLVVYAPVDEDGKLSDSAQTNGVLNAEDAAKIASVSNVSALQANGIVLTPPKGYAVSTLYIAAAKDDDKLEAVDPEFASLTGEGTQIEVAAKFFSGSKFNDTATEYTLYLCLSRAVHVSAVEATCEKAGQAAFYSVNAAPYLTTNEDLVIAAKGHKIEKVEAQEATEEADGVKEHYKCTVCEKLFKDAEGKEETTADEVKLPKLTPPAEHQHDLEKVEAKEATAEAEGNIEYYKCKDAECGKLFKDAEGKEETTADEVKLPKLTPPAEHQHDLEKVEAKEATAEADGNIEYYKCKDAECGKFFKDAAGTEEITDKDSVVTKYEAPAEHQHDLEKVEAKEATAEADGNIEYYKCKDAECGKFFKDAAGTEEITDKSSVVTKYEAPAAEHTHSLKKVAAKAATSVEDGNTEYWVCEDESCGKYFSDAEGKTEITDKNSVVVKATGKPLTEGTDTSWKKGSKDGLKIHIDAVYADSLKDTLVVKVGTAVVPKDKYTVTSGSVTVTIDPSYMETLDAGEHEITITFPSGNEVKTKVTIPEASADKLALSLAIDEKGFTKVYDGKSFDLNALKDYITVVNLPSGYKADVEISFEDSSVKEFHNAGTTKVKLHLKSVKDASDNDVPFTCDDKKGVKLTITKRKITVETRDDSKVYDGKAWTYSHMSNPQPIMTYTDAKLGEYARDGKTYVQQISIKYTASPKNMGTYDNKAELIIREKEKGSSADGTVVTDNYEITYKFGKIKITDSKGNVPKTTGAATGDENNIWLWVGLMAAAVIVVVVILVISRKGKKSGNAQNP